MNQPLSNADYEELQRAGISREDAAQQLKILCCAPQRLSVVRPCTLNDGIQTVSDSEATELANLHQQSAKEGRWIKFVPASGAASRMFALKNPGDHERLCQQLNKFAFRELLENSLHEAGKDISELLQHKAYSEIVDHLLHKPGLGYAKQPKGLLLFHQYADCVRTPFEEHLREAARCFRGEDGRSRAHFTVSDEHRDQFDELLAQLQPVIATALETQVDVRFSVQKSSTDMLAMDEDDAPVRNVSGQILRRPGGHGSLLENLHDLSADLIFVKNIDNVFHERMQGPTELWIQSLGGYLVRLQQLVHSHLRALESGGSEQAIQSAEGFVSEQFPSHHSSKDGDAKSRLDQLREFLDRPIRICGMVRNEGEPGGGPFWVRESDGSDGIQIVENAEIDPDDQDQQAIFQSSTHFNPVFMALGVRDYRGNSFNLRKYVDPNRFILTKKVSDGRTIRVVERPGLWNGSMANWITVFVEVPKQVFSPVKTVFDLLRDEHQP